MVKKDQIGCALSAYTNCPFRLMGKDTMKEHFIERKRMKKWYDKKDGSVCFTLYAKCLAITWDNCPKWSWESYKDTEDDNILVAKLMYVCWLEVRGRFEMSKLSRGVTYEVVFVIKLTKSASGWDHPVTFSLRHSGITKNRNVSLLMSPKDEWFELNLGCFENDSDGQGFVGFDLVELDGGHWKNGLIIKSVIIRRKH